MNSLDLGVSGSRFTLAERDVHYLLWDGQGLRVSTTPADGHQSSGIQQLGYFAAILGRWFFHADNVPAARRLRIDGQAVTNVRHELPARCANVAWAAGVSTGPHNPRPTARPPAAGGPAARPAPDERQAAPGRPRTRPDGGSGHTYTIGRVGTHADIEIDDPLVRARHATVRIDGKGRWWIAGPVYVNGVKQMTSTLREGDIFVIGQTAVTVTPDLLPPRARRAAPLREPRELVIGSRRRPSTETGLAVDLSHVTVRGDQGTFRLDDVSLSITAGEVVAVVGPSGAGKSSLIGVLLGELAEEQGTVRIGPPCTGRAGPELRRQQVRYVPQADDLYETLTIRETLTYAARLRAASDTGNQEIATRVDDVLARLTLNEPATLPGRRVSTLSGGQKRRVSIGLELVGNPQLLLLDEPTSGLDAGKDRGIMADLRKVSNSYRCTVIVVTHATEHLGYADKVVVLARGGRVRYVGAPDRVLATFGHQSWADLMEALDREPPDSAAARTPPPGPTRRAPIPVNPSMRGFPTLLARQATLTRRRGRGWFAILLTLPVICTAIAIAASDEGLRPGTSMTSVLSILVTVAALSGASLTYLDLVNESAILRRDWRVGVEVLPILLAKATVFSGLCATLSTVVGVLFTLARDLPPTAYSVPPLVMLLSICFMIMMSSMGAGLLISALSRRQEQAVTGSTLLAVLQVALSGSLFKLQWSLQLLTVGLPARVGLAAVASYADLNRYQHPALYEDWLWAHGAARYWGLILALASIFCATFLGAVYQLQRHWRCSTIR